MGRPKDPNSRQIGGDAFGPRSRRSGRAALRLAGFATSIAIAGCSDQRPIELRGAWHCTNETHRTVMIPQTHFVGKVPVTTYIYVPQTDCHQWTEGRA